MAAARTALGDELRSVVLYGSAAEGRLRATSDVNLIVVLASFEPPKVGALREQLRRAYAIARVTPCFCSETTREPVRSSRPALPLRLCLGGHGYDPRTRARLAGLSPEESARLGALDAAGLELAAESFAKKRAFKDGSRASRWRFFG